MKQASSYETCTASQAFSSVAGISNCFLTEDGAPATPTHPGVDVASLCEALKQIVATDELLRTHLSSAVHRTALELSAMKHHKIEQVSR